MTHACGDGHANGETIWTFGCLDHKDSKEIFVVKMLMHSP